MILKKPMIQSFEHFVSIYRQNVDKIIDSTIEDVVNEDQYNQSKVRSINIDITYNIKGNWPTKIFVYGNGEGMNQKTLEENYFYLGAKNLLDGRGQYGDGGKQGAVWGKKSVFSLKDNEVSEGHISPYVDGTEVPLDKNTSVNFHVEESEKTYTVESLRNLLSSDHGTLTVTEIQRDMAKQQKWINLDDIKNEIQTMGKYYHIRHTLSTSKVTIRFINDSTGETEDNYDFEKPKEISLIDEQSIIIPPEVSGIKMDKKLQEFEQGNNLPKKPTESNITLIIGEIKDAVKDQKVNPDSTTRESGILFMSDNGEIFDNKFGSKKYERQLLYGIDAELTNLIGGKIILPDILFRSLQKSSSGDFLTIKRKGMNIKNTIAKNLTLIVENEVKKYLDKIKAKYRTTTSDSSNTDFDFSSKSQEYNKLKSEIQNEEIDPNKGKPIGKDFWISPEGFPIKTGKSKSVLLVLHSNFVDKIERINIKSSNDDVAAEEELSISDDIITTQSTKAWYSHPKWPEFQRTAVSIIGKSVGSAEIEFEIELKNNEKLSGSPSVAKVHVSDDYLPEIDSNELMFEKKSYGASLKTTKVIKVLIGSAIGSKIFPDDITLNPIEGVNILSDTELVFDEESSVVTSNNLTTPYYAKFKISLDENFKKDIDTLECVVKTSDEKGKIVELICKTKIKRLKVDPVPQWHHITKKKIKENLDQGDDQYKIIEEKTGNDPVHIIMGDTEKGESDNIYFITTRKLFKNYVILTPEGEIDWSQNESLLSVSRVHAGYALGVELHQQKYDKPGYVDIDNQQRSQDESNAIKTFITFFNDVNPSTKSK